MIAELGRGAAELDEVVVRRHAEHLEPAAGVVAGLSVEVGDRRVLRVGRAVGVRRLGLLVEGVDLLDVQERQQVAVDVAQGERLALGDAVARLDRQRDRQRPERPVGQPASRRRPARSRPCPGSLSAERTRRQRAVPGRRARVRRGSGSRESLAVAFISAARASPTIRSTSEPP